MYLRRVNVRGNDALNWKSLQRRRAGALKALLGALSPLTLFPVALPHVPGAPARFGIQSGCPPPAAVHPICGGLWVL